MAVLLICVGVVLAGVAATCIVAILAIQEWKEWLWSFSGAC